MTRNISAIVHEFNSQVKAILKEHYRNMILYGSYARNSADESSDIDLMIHVDLTQDGIRQIEDDIYDAAFELEISYGIHISPMIINEEHFNYWVEDLPFYRNVKNEGAQVA